MCSGWRGGSFSIDVGGSVIKSRGATIVQSSSHVDAKALSASSDDDPDGVITPADQVVTLRHVGKCYRLYDRPQDRLKDHLLQPLGRRYGREFWALRDVSLTVQRGEVIGIIGRNGSGKSTLLQLLAGVLQASAGEVEVQGRVAALLELGSGFNPDYTGHDNILMNAAILGISRAEVETRYDEVVAFADIGAFVDQPIKNYSSGMLMRLAFAVQVCVYPDVLIIDEVLAVGDAAFQRKCYRRLEALRERGCTIVIVSHDLNAVAHLCSRAVLLDGGCLMAQGAPDEVSQLYQKMLFGEETAAPTHAYGDGCAEFLDVWFENPRGERIASVASSSAFDYSYRLRFLHPVADPIFGLSIKNVQGMLVSATNTHLLGHRTGQHQSHEEVVVRWTIRLPLTPGTYFFSCGCSYPDIDRFLCRRVDALKLTVVGALHHGGVVQVVQAVSVDRA